MGTLMRYVGLLLILVGVVASPLLAEPTAEEAEWVAGEAQRLTRTLTPKLGLSGEQVPELQAAMQELMLEQLEILSKRSGHDLSQVSLRLMQHELDVAQDRAMERLAGVLSDEQGSGLDLALQTQRAEVAGDAMVRRLSEPLVLSVEQQAQLRPIFSENLNARYEAALYMKSKSRYKTAFTDFQDTMKKLDQELVDELREVLTSEQMAGYFKITREMLQPVESSDASR